MGLLMPRGPLPGWGHRPEAGSAVAPQTQAEVGCSRGSRLQWEGIGPWPVFRTIPGVVLFLVLICPSSYLLMCVSTIHLSTYYPSICPLTHSPIHPSICSSTHPSIHPPTHPSMHLSTHCPIHLSTHHPPIRCPPVHPSARLPSAQHLLGHMPCSPWSTKKIQVPAGRSPSEPLPSRSPLTR